MSGGHFDYKQSQLGYIAEEIEQLIINNKQGRQYPIEIIVEFRQAIYHLLIAQIYVQRIDWLVSGDDDSDTFLRCLLADLVDLEKQYNVFDLGKPVDTSAVNSEPK